MTKKWPTVNFILICYTWSGNASLISSYGCDFNVIILVLAALINFLKSESLHQNKNYIKFFLINIFRSSGTHFIGFVMPYPKQFTEKV